MNTKNLPPISSTAERAKSHANVLALQEANRLKDEFIGIASHELRTPLTTVKASVQLISRQVTRLLKLETALSPETLILFSQKNVTIIFWQFNLASCLFIVTFLIQNSIKLITAMQSLLNRAERQIDIQNRLVNDLLDISRIETGRSVTIQLSPSAVMASSILAGPTSGATPA